MCRKESNGGRAKNDKSGVPYYVHRLNGAASANGNGYTHPGHLRPKPSSQRQVEAVEAADLDTLDKAYRFILDNLALSAEHRDALHKRGFSDEEIDRRGYRSFPFERRREIASRLVELVGQQTCRRVPGFLAADEKHGARLAGPEGLLVPCRDVAGRIVALKVRRDSTPNGEGKYAYLSSAKHGGAGPGAPVHVPLSIVGPVELVRLTEGEVKSDLATVLSGVPTISVPGVAAWQKCLPVLRSLGAKTVRVAFDADARHKQAVARALLDCIKALPRQGFAVELECWPESAGKGIDEVLAAGAATEVLAGNAALAAAREIAAAAGVPIEGPATATVSVEGVGDVTLTVEAAGAKPQRKVSATIGDVRHDDRIDTASAGRRKQFIFALADKAKASREALYATLDTPLGELAEKADANASKSQAAERSSKPVSFDETDSQRYRVSEAGCICRLKRFDDEVVEIPMCNFAARIVEEVTRDDGAEQRTMLTVAGELAGGEPLPSASVAADEFLTMNWPMRVWGSRAVVRAGNGNKDLLREAIQVVSPDAVRRTVYAQTGWRFIGGKWHYLHAAGAINADGLTTDVATDLPDALAPFVLPAPATGDELRRALLASLAILDLANERITAPLIAAVYRAPLGDADFSLHAAGPSGAFKSETAALAQQHFGAGFDSRHLPANWQSTANAVEGIAFTAADTLLVVDDFAPQGSFTDQARCHRDADRIFRAQGNRAGRARMSADGRLRPTKPPRGLILSTGEDLPKGQSVRGRIFALDVANGEIPSDRLSACQRDARDGLYAGAMAAYLQWLAPFYGELRGRLSREAVELRDALAAGDGHARTPGIVADLAIGLRYLLRFAVEAGVIGSTRADALMQRGCAGIVAAARSHAKHSQDAEPAQHFGRLLGGVIASGRGHVANVSGGPPRNPGAWGWRETTVGTGQHERIEWQAQGNRIGWLDDEELYLEPDAAYAAAQRMAGEQGDALAVTQTTLWKRLKERGFLVAVEEKRETLKVRKTVEGASHGVLHVAQRLLSAENPTNPTTNPLTADAIASFACRVSCRVSPPATKNPTENPTTPTAEPPSTSGEPVGFVGFPAHGSDGSERRERNGRERWVP
jgi:hypothetical protein